MNDHFYISTAYLRFLMLADKSHISKVLNSLNLQEADILDRAFISGDLVTKIFHQYHQKGIRSWVLSFGQFLNVGSHGSLGFAAVSAPNLISAFQVLSTYLASRLSAYQMEIIETDTDILIRFTETCKDDIVGRWLIESGIYSVKNLAETIMTHPIRNNLAISFSYPESEVQSELNKLFNVTCEFDQQYNQISMPASWRTIQSPYYDEETYRSNITKCREILLSFSSNHHDVETQVTERLKYFFDELYTGNRIENTIPSLTEIASQLHMSSRTLIRRLEKKNTSYKSLLEKIRQQQATYLLKNTHLSVSEIAEKLGYNETSNFGRAFKKWFRTSPAAWRRK